MFSRKCQSDCDKVRTPYLGIGLVLCPHLSGQATWKLTEDSGCSSFGQASRFMERGPVTTPRRKRPGIQLWSGLGSAFFPPLRKDVGGFPVAIIGLTSACTWEPFLTHKAKGMDQIIPKSHYSADILLSIYPFSRKIFKNMGFPGKGGL